MHVYSLPSCRLETRTLGCAVDARANGAARGLGGRCDSTTQHRIERLGEIHMWDTVGAVVKRMLPPPGVIDELIRDGQLSGRKSGMDRTDGVQQLCVIALTLR